MSVSTAPVLSTPADDRFEPIASPINASIRLSDEQLYVQYEIHRTVREIRDGRWQRIGLQFPDGMMVDAPRVSDSLSRELKRIRKKDTPPEPRANLSRDRITGNAEGIASEVGALDIKGTSQPSESTEEDQEHYLTILGDTSYGACCVDEIAAEHVDADVVVHYGRSCLSPTARLPVIYVFTSPPLDLEAAIEAFKRTYSDVQERVILMADVPYQSHVPALAQRLCDEGYSNLFATDILHNPGSPLPNRTVPDEVQSDLEALKACSIFHVSHPPNSLLLILSSRVRAIHTLTTATTTAAPEVLVSNTSVLLRRRYALLTSISTAPILGLLINTLSVKNYMSALAHCQALITRAGKKSYTFVVGKLNAAKLANFAEIEGWVIIGCWESSLVDSGEFYKPVITPFELEVALQGDGRRQWGGEWVGDFGSLLSRASAAVDETNADDGPGYVADTEDGGEGSSSAHWNDEESDDEPPEFDLRTGKYVSRSRPMGRPKPVAAASSQSRDVAATASSALIQRAKGDVAAVNGVVSPGADFLRSQRTWTGLGSDERIAYERDADGKIIGASMEQGREGVARGFAVAGSAEG
ncbi:Diphthamide biosynthesis protein 2 [Oleoguttula sp. CCFEE 5521]